MNQYNLGIDMAKDTFDVALLGSRQTHRGHFSNDPTGFTKLARWLLKRQAQEAHACLEATGRYWEDLALFLHDQGHQVSVVNPKLIKKHAETTMQRNKTDKEDALTIADYCAKHQPAVWQPPSPAQRQLKALVRHVKVLKSDRQREVNRKHSGVPSQDVVEAIDAHIAFLEGQINDLEQRIQDLIDEDPDIRRDKELLTSIPGIGDITAAALLAEIPDVSRFAQASQLDAYAGLTPGQRQSGKSIPVQGHLVKWGNAHLRAALFMPALSSHRWNPIIAALRLRLQARDKSKMTIIVAIMRKLLHLAYGVLKTGKPFDPNYRVNLEQTT
jgi:transposase